MCLGQCWFHRVLGHAEQWESRGQQCWAEKQDSSKPWFQGLPLLTCRLRRQPSLHIREPLKTCQCPDSPRPTKSQFLKGTSIGILMCSQKRAAGVMIFKLTVTSITPWQNVSVMFRYGLQSSVPPINTKTAFSSPLTVL